MKTVFFALLLALVSASTSYARADLSCTSVDKIYGWTGTTTYEFLSLTGKVVSATELRGAQVSGAFRSDRRDVRIQPYRPIADIYKELNRYQTLEDAWNWFSPLLPKNLPAIAAGTEFKGYLRVYNENGYVGTHELTCKKN